jgi:hypothetical protein
LPQTITLPRDIAGVRIPDSALARKTVNHVFHLSSSVVWNHVMRTFVFGSIVGKAQGARYDEELFFLGAVLHDMGLTGIARGQERFELVGADAAVEFLKKEGVTPERQEVVWDAVALHTSVGIASRKRPEIALVHIGAGIDVLGRQLDKLPPNLVAQTIEALPRTDFKNKFLAEVIETIAPNPSVATMTFLHHSANEHFPGSPCPSFHHLAKNSPFAE